MGKAQETWHKTWHTSSFGCGRSKELRDQFSFFNMASLCLPFLYQQNYPVLARKMELLWRVPPPSDRAKQPLPAPVASPARALCRRSRVDVGFCLPGCCSRAPWGR